MKLATTVIFAWAVLAGTARAQSSAAPDTGYAEFFAQSAFGNVTSQAYGGEAGYTINPQLQVFGEFGWVRDTAPSSLAANAQKIATGIAAAAGTTNYSAKQPVTFGVGGVKFRLPLENSRVAPYVLAGGGIGAVKRDVTFTTASGDASQYATLGSDLSGTESAFMLSLGGGVGIPLGSVVLVDVQYRYGRVFTANEGLSINRAGVGLGVRF
jgi:opacity protein-like surface antigen